MNFKLEQFDKFIDKRGDLIVFLKNKDLSSKNRTFGQIYLVTFGKKGVVRGCHYHKKWTEWFGIVSGKVKVVLEDVNTKQRVEMTLDANLDKYTRLNIGPNIAHYFRSLTKNAVLLNYADSEWRKSDSISYKFKHI